MSWKIQTLAHELGHSIGLHHTDYNTPAANPLNIPGTLIAGTWSTDPSSIMNHVINKGWTGFPYLDQLAIRTLYPLDQSEKPFYAYRKDSSGGYNWTPQWSTYAYGAQGFTYWGHNGFIFTSPRPNTVLLYKYRQSGTMVDYMSLDPNLEVAYPSYVSQGFLGYVYTSPGTDRIPVYEWYNPNHGYHFTTLLGNDQVINSGGWVGGGIAFYVIKLA